MNKFNIILNSEIDRALLASDIIPTESRLETLLKRKVSKGFAVMARRLNPVSFSPRIVPAKSHC